MSPTRAKIAEHICNFRMTHQWRRRRPQRRWRRAQGCLYWSKGPI